MLLKRATAGLASWVAIEEAPVLAARPIAEILDVGRFEEANGDPRWRGGLRWAVLLVGALTITQTSIWLGYWMFTTGGRGFGIYPVFFTLAGAMILRSQPLYGLFFVLLGNTFVHGMERAELRILALDPSLLLISVLFLMLFSEWRAETGRRLRWFYGLAALFSAMPAVPRIDEWMDGISMGSLSLVVPLVVAFAAHTERSFRLGAKKTVRALVLTMSVGFFLALIVEAQIRGGFVRWGVTYGYAAMMISPSGCLLFEWAHRWRLRNHRAGRGVSP